MFNKKNKTIKEEIKCQGGLCQYRSKCTDFKKKCDKCKNNELNDKKSYFR